MATLADSIIGNLLAGTGYGRTVNDFAAQDVQNRLGEQRIQAGNLELAQAGLAQQREQGFMSDWAKYQDNPTPDGIMQLAAKYPERAKGLQDAWKLKDDAVKQAD